MRTDYGKREPSQIINFSFRKAVSEAIDGLETGEHNFLSSSDLVMIASVTVPPSDTLSPSPIEAEEGKEAG